MTEEQKNVLKLLESQPLWITEFIRKEFEQLQEFRSAIQFLANRP